MGGGDLNMKKSWHPLTMQNLERVWKAEQRHEAEQKRIAELQQEIKEERVKEEMRQMAVDSGISRPRDERVDWLYRGPGAVNTEDYLLGKRIDKSIDPTLIAEEREKESLANGPGALFSITDAVNTAADLELKIREDPLLLMRKKEEEAKKRILNNPVKMKQLKELLEKDKSKKKKKDKKSHRRGDSDDESTDEKTSHKRRERSRSPDERRKARDRSSRGSSDGQYSSRGSSKHRPPRRPPSPQRKSGSTNVTRKMDSTELERRRNEMMSLAKDRAKDRQTSLRNHELEMKKEESEHTVKQEQFLHKLRVQSITSSKSVEDRIHRHINSVQRTNAALNDFMNR